MTIHDVSIRALQGGPADLEQYRGHTMLIVNVASKCGLTPQYASLQKLYESYADKGFVVLAVPCNQFGGQEPGTSNEIADFCEVNFGVTFPITEKVDVNGEDRHVLFETLTSTPDPDGAAGDVRWNFEKFIVDPEGSVVARFRPLTDPLSPDLIGAVEKYLPAEPPTVEATRAAEPAPVPFFAPPAPPAPSGLTPAAPVAEPVGRRGLLGRWAKRRAGDS